MADKNDNVTVNTTWGNGTWEFTACFKCDDDDLGLSVLERLIAIATEIKAKTKAPDEAPSPLAIFHMTGLPLTALDPTP